MTPEETTTPKATDDHGAIIKQKIAKQLAHFLLLKNKKPDRVQLIVTYSESVAKLDIHLND